MDFSKVKEWEIPYEGEMRGVREVSVNGRVVWRKPGGDTLPKYGFFDAWPNDSSLRWRNDAEYAENGRMTRSCIPENVGYVCYDTPPENILTYDGLAEEGLKPSVGNPNTVLYKIVGWKDQYDNSYEFGQKFEPSDDRPYYFRPVWRLTPMIVYDSNFDYVERA